eukprot:gene20055-22022_t
MEWLEKRDLNRLLSMILAFIMTNLWKLFGGRFVWARCIGSGEKALPEKTEFGGEFIALQIGNTDFSFPSKSEFVVLHADACDKWASWNIVFTGTLSQVKQDKRDSPSNCACDYPSIKLLANQKFFNCWSDLLFCCCDEEEYVDCDLDSSPALPIGINCLSSKTAYGFEKDGSSIICDTALENDCFEISFSDCDLLEDHDQATDSDSASQSESELFEDDDDESICFDDESSEDLKIVFEDHESQDCPAKMIIQSNVVMNFQPNGSSLLIEDTSRFCLNGMLSSYCNISEDDCFCNEPGLSNNQINDILANNIREFIICKDTCDKSLKQQKKPQTSSKAEQIASQNTKKKSVMFAADEQLVTIHPMISWAHAYQDARKGHWHQYALDRCHFRRRINQSEDMLKDIYENKYKQFMQSS